MDFASTTEWGEPLLGPANDAVRDAQVKKAMRLVPRDLATVARLPWLWDVMFTGIQKPPFSYASPRDIHLVSLVSSHENACRYCYGAVRALMRIQGHSDAEIDRLEGDLQLAEVTPSDRALLEFARKLARSRPRPVAEEARRLEAGGRSAAEVKELAFVVGKGVFASRVSTLLALQPETRLESFSRKPIVKLLRPLFARMFRMRPMPAPASRTWDGPFAPVLAHFDGLPAAAYLDAALRGAMASEVLSKRAKLLVFSVVARSLACPVCEPVAGGELAAEGLSPADVEEILTHLASPKLDPVERALVPWARETVRYRPGDIQKATRSLAEVLGPDRTLEAVGVAALANMTVRLAMFAS